MATTIGAPTEQGLREYRQGDIINPADPRINVPPGTTAPMGTITTSTDILPSRVTGKRDEGVSEDYSGVDLGYISDFARGANDLILALPDAAINAVAEGLEAVGIVEPNTVDRRYLARIFNSSDFESQKVIIPYLLHYGTGEFAGQADQEGLGAKISRGAGQAGVASLPLVGMQMRAAAIPSTQVTRLGSSTPYLGVDVLGKGAATPSTTTTTQRIVEGMVAPFRTSPGTAAAVETGLGAASGAGAVTEQELFGTSGTVGALAPILPAAAATALGKTPGINLAKKGFNWTKSFVKGKVDDTKVLTGKVKPGEGAEGEAALAKLGSEVQEAAATPQAQVNLQRAAEIEARLGGYADEPIALSPAEATLDAPLLATQTRMEGTGDAAFTRANNQRKTNVLTAAQRFIDGDLTASPVDDAPMFVYNQAEGTYAATVGRINADSDELAANWSMVTDSDTGVYPKLGSRSDVGANIRKAIVDAEQAAKDDAAALATKLKINDADPVGDANTTVAAQAAVRDSLTSRAGDKAISYQGLPPLVRKFVEFKFKDNRMSFQDWKSFRDQVGSAIGKASAVGDKASIRPLAILSDQLDNMAASYGKTNEKFDDFRIYYDANVVTPFQRSGVTRVTAKGQGSTKERPQYYVADEKVADAFLQDTNTAKQFMKLFADKPADMRAMKNVVLDKLRTTAFNQNKGIFEPDKVNKYINTNREVLTELGIIDDLLDTETMLREMVTRNAELEVRRRTINGNLLMGSVARATKNESPDQLFTEALRSPAKMRELKRIASQATDDLTEEEASRAFRSAITQKMLDKAPTALSDPTAFKQWMVRNEEVLDAAFDKSHVDNLYLMADAAERVLITGIGRGKGVTDEDIVTRFTSALGTTPAGISNRFIAVQEGRLGSKAMVGYILSRAIRQQSGVRSDALFREAMFDPDIARLLTTEGSESVPPLGISEPNKRRLNAFLFNIGVDYGDGITGEGAKETLILEPNITDQPILQTPPPAPDPVPPPKPFPLPPTPTIPNRPAAAPPTAPPLNTAQVGIETLFPNDPTSIAIAKRRGAGQGAMRTV